MKKILMFLPILLLVSFACEESTTETPIKNSPIDFFPNSDGNYYNYNVSVIDTNDIILQTGTRKSVYNGDTLMYGTSFQVKSDVFELTSLQTENNSYFRKKILGVNNGVALDSIGSYYILPDSLRGNFSLALEYPILYESLEVNQTWHVFDIQADIPQFEIFNVDAEVISLDTLTISYQNTTRTTEVFNIKYNARLTTGINQLPIIFEVHAWIAKGIGFIKWEGDAKLINFFAGAEIYPTNTSVLEELYLFKVN